MSVSLEPVAPQEEPADIEETEEAPVDAVPTPKQPTPDQKDPAPLEVEGGKQP